MDVVISVVILIGALFTALAGVGVIRFPDLYSRMHAATKATALGFALVALAAAWDLADGRFKLVLAVGLILLTSPVAAHLVGRSSYRAPNVPVRIDSHDALAESGILDQPDE